MKSELPNAEHKHKSQQYATSMRSTDKILEDGSFLWQSKSHSFFPQNNEIHFISSAPKDIQYADIDHMNERMDFTIDNTNFNGLGEYFSKLRDNGMRTIIILVSCGFRWCNIMHWLILIKFRCTFDQLFGCALNLGQNMDEFSSIGREWFLKLWIYDRGRSFAEKYSDMWNGKN